MGTSRPKCARRAVASSADEVMVCVWLWPAGGRQRYQEASSDVDVSLSWLQAVISSFSVNHDGGSSSAKTPAPSNATTSPCMHAWATITLS
jgi:hypothetical protein